MRSGGMNVRYISEDIPMQTMSQILQEVFRTVCYSSSPEKVFKAKTVSTWRTLFVGLEYFRGRAETKVTYINYLEAPKFVNFIDKSVRYLSGLLSENLFGDTGMKKSFSFMGVDCSKVFKANISQRDSPTEEKTPARIVLDRDAISEAQSDLAAVTGMMYVPEGENNTVGAVPEPEVPSVTQAQDDPWMTLSCLLESSEKDYLDALLRSPDLSMKVLMDNSITRTKMEDSINSKSLDCIGDTIIENGLPVNDYLNDIRKLRQ